MYVLLTFPSIKDEMKMLFTSTDEYDTLLGRNENYLRPRLQTSAYSSPTAPPGMTVLKGRTVSGIHFRHFLIGKDHVLEKYLNITTHMARKACSYR